MGGEEKNSGQRLDQYLTQEQTASRPVTRSQKKNKRCLAVYNMLKRGNPFHFTINLLGETG